MRYLIAVFAIGAMLLATPAARAQAPASQASMPPLPPQPAVRPDGMPAGYVMVSPCIAGMGEHWANVQTNAPLIYGTYQGKIVFTEIMVPVSVLDKGFSFADIRALPGRTIDHIDFEFEPNGHEGMPVPHYDLHAYYVSPEVEKTICPDGIPNPAMKPTNE